MAFLDQCQISSIRCRNRNIGDGTPLLRLWRGGASWIPPRRGMDPGDRGSLRVGVAERPPAFQTIFGYIEESVDDGIVRIVGLLAVVVGLALIYVGVYVV